MSYNLKDHINEWVNIELSIDNTNNQAEIFINGSKKDTITYDKKLTKNSQSKLHFGSRADRSKGFRGKLENINISNSKTNETISSAKYNQLKGNSKKQMFNMDFKNTSSSSRKVSERSKYKSSAKFNKPDGETGATLVADDGKDAVNFSSGDFMEIDAGASMNGELLKNSTFTSWVKLPPTHSKSGYEPIISRENVFSFGVNNGHASLFLSQNNQLAPGANITKTDHALMVMDETFAKATFGQNDSIVKVNKNGSLVTNVIESDMIEYSGVAKSKALKLTTNDKVEIDKLTYTGRDLSKFSMSMWMKPDQLSDNMVLFSRPEMGLALKANSSGKLNLEYTKFTENKIQLSHVANTSSTGSSTYKSSIVKAPNTTYAFLSNVNDSRMGTTTQKIYDNVTFADDTVTIYMKYTTGSTYQPNTTGHGEGGTFFHTGVNGVENFPRLEFSYMGAYNGGNHFMYALGIDGNPEYPCEVRLQFKAPSPAINTEYEIMMTVSKTQLENASISNSNGSARVYLDGVLLDDISSKINYVSTFSYIGHITTSGSSKSYSDLAIPRMKNATEHYGYGDAVINQLGFFDGDVPYGTMTISQPSTVISTISTLQIYDWNGSSGLHSTTNGPRPISSYLELDGGSSSNPYFMINLDKFYKVHGVQISAKSSYSPFKNIEYRVGTSTSSYESFSGYPTDTRYMREFNFELANAITTNKIYLGFISSSDIYNLKLHSLVVYGETVPTEEYTLRLLGHHSGTTGVISMTRIKAYNGTTEVPIALVKEAEPRSGKNNLAALTQENNTTQVQWGNPDNTTELAALVGEKIVTIQSTSEITRIEIEWDATYTGTFDVLRNGTQTTNIITHPSYINITGGTWQNQMRFQFKNISGTSTYPDRFILYEVYHIANKYGYGESMSIQYDRLNTYWRAGPSSTDPDSVVWDAVGEWRVKTSGSVKASFDDPFIINEVPNVTPITKFQINYTGWSTDYERRSNEDYGHIFRYFLKGSSTGYRIAYNWKTRTWVDADPLIEPTTMIQTGSTVQTYDKDGNTFSSFTDPYYSQ